VFTNEEQELIKKEYTYNDSSRQVRKDTLDPVDCFTEHNLDSIYNSLKNHSTKSVILAPFNSTHSKIVSPLDLIDQEMLESKHQVLQFSKRCREVDRQYEFNNNGKLDNGVYHKVPPVQADQKKDYHEVKG